MNRDLFVGESWMFYLCDAFIHNIKYFCDLPKKFFRHPFTLRKKVAEFLKQTLIFTQKDPISFSWIRSSQLVQEQNRKRRFAKKDYDFCI